MQLSQEMMAFLTRPFPNELNAGYFGAPCLQLWLEEIKREFIGTVRNLKGMIRCVKLSRLSLVLFRFGAVYPDHEWVDYILYIGF